MAVGLYTSRVILQTLGISDYGIYNIVGGVVVLFSFISYALRNATQRFLSYEIGLGDKGNVQKVFNMSIQCHLYISLLIIILAETVGLWFVNTFINIPTGRQIAVLWVYQFSIFTFIIQILQVPYNATIVSHERMSFYAYTSIYEVSLKLAIVYLLVSSTWDKLIVYSILVSGVYLMMLFIYIIYCYKKIGVKTYRYVNDRNLFLQLMGFSGWSMANGCTTILAQQGGNYFINIFCGVAANAAYGIANQVSGLIYSFVSNFQIAFQPQIVKHYASNNKRDLFEIIKRTSSASYYLLLLITIPFAVESDYVLTLWLGTVPDYAAIFCKLLLVYYLLDAIQAPLWMLIYSTGKIKIYTIWSGIITILNLPISWFLLSNDWPIYSIFVVKVILNFLCCIIRIIYVGWLTDFDSWSYTKSVLFRALIVTVPTLLVSYSLKLLPLHPITVIVFSLLVVALFVLVGGFSRYDRNILINLIMQKILRR
ncbi:MATE family efflux transporter [Macellibacteroides fermentans]|uniref:MATE family efflux transporter n=1 Tax=Macellibacteroides fermentans TaxID=879969 RepID=UPI00406D4844